jgi:hypothetical protein
MTAAWISALAATSNETQRGWATAMIKPLRMLGIIVQLPAFTCEAPSIARGF